MVEANELTAKKEEEESAICLYANQPLGDLRINEVL